MSQNLLQEKLRKSWLIFSTLPVYVSRTSNVKRQSPSDKFGFPYLPGADVG